MLLKDKVAVITGGAGLNGLGFATARQMAAQGAKVVILDLERAKPAQAAAQLGEGHLGLVADVTNKAQCDAAAAATIAKFGRIDILLNNGGGYERMIDNGIFTWSQPFWEQPPWRWDAMFDAGVRAHYRASQLAVPSMIARRRGLIVNISFWSAQKHVGNVAYGVAKAATDKMTADMAMELAPHGVAVVSLYPGLVRTEKVMEAAAWLDLSNSESPEFIGRAVAALAGDANVMARTGSVQVAAQLGREYGFTDIDGKSPRPLALGDV